MSAHQCLAALYADWRRLTEAEGEAISRAAWSRVADCQRAKAELRSRILAATTEWEAQRSSLDPAGAEEEPRLRALVAELISLESRNQQRLANQYEQARLSQAVLDRASSNLRQIRRAYAPSPRLAWQSYS